MINIRAALAQMNPVVGDILGNTCRVLDSIATAREQGARAIVFPELVLTGYPPEDLLLRPSLQPRLEKALAKVAQAATDIYVIVGYPWASDEKLFNAAGVFFNGKKIAEYCKQELPNYRVFDEKRYFTAGEKTCVFDLDGVQTALLICEDIWQEKPAQAARDAGAECLLVLNASPFHVDKQHEREAMLAARAQDVALPILYCNAVGGQDELVFDGGSCAVSAQGEVIARAALFAETHLPVVIDKKTKGVQLSAPAPLATIPNTDAAIYKALVCSVRDYVNKNGFRGVLLGLSGGIDSALTLAIAVDALGAECVEAVMMPYHYTASISV
ncbi:MAG TPA: nitrilase-related carbon-nitrogen hydrolase, partial [Pseudomonadales bacterium]|nr:nitrilase-related carbon-nitrogen hydrolase [Pseudomonadales bacterium]